MKRTLAVVAVIAGLAGLAWLMTANLDTGTAERTQTASIILRPPDDFVVDDLGTTSLADAATSLATHSGERVGVRFDDGGDSVILLADRTTDEVIEMRAARTGTIVERHWLGDLDRRLQWAGANDNLDLPGSTPPTGKNLYH